ncbi:MAG: hypothetical protein IJF37_06720 [Lachnospiraceae bacterium]|nr:hypothetical protein [Lachnospiraceae bacterium]
MKKKGLSVILCTGLMVCMLTACGEKEDNKKANVAQSATVPQEEISTEENNSSTESTIKEPQTEETTEEPTTEQEKIIYKLSKEINGDADGSEFVQYQYEYDEAGNIIKQLSLYSDGEIRELYSYKYDSTGKLYKQEYDLDNDGKINTVTLYEYDEDGNLCKETYYKGNCEYLTSITEYEANGEIKLKTEYGTDANTLKQIVYLSNYTYDSNHNMLMMIKKIDGGKHIATVEYEYDSNGNLIKMSEEVTVNSALGYGYEYVYEHTYEYEYNADGKLIKENVKQFSEGSKYSDAYDRHTTYEYQYDTNGNAIKKITTDSDNQSLIGKYMKYEYITFTEE